jgi:hypothetical protein
MARALRTSVDTGVFGVEEDGSNVNPGDAEIADALTDQPTDAEREELLKKYAEDFGQKAPRNSTAGAG